MDHGREGQAHSPIPKISTKTSLNQSYIPTQNFYKNFSNPGLIAKRERLCYSGGVLRRMKIADG